MRSPFGARRMPLNRWQQEKINAQQVEQFVEATPAISPPPYGAIEEIVEYLLHDEEEDWKAKGKPAKHIYHSVRTVADWLAAQA